MTTPHQHYKVKDVAGLLSISTEQVHQLISDGSLGAINIGRGSKAYWRVSQADLDSYLERQRHANTYGKAVS